MALFIAQLAFPPGAELETIKFAILCGSILAGIISFFAGYRVLNVPGDPHGAATDAEVEPSTSN